MRYRGTLRSCRWHGAQHMDEDGRCEQCIAERQQDREVDIVEMQQGLVEVGCAVCMSFGRACCQRHREEQP